MAIAKSTTTKPQSKSTVWYLKNCGIFKVLPDQELAQIAQQVIAKHFPKKGELFSPGQARGKVYLLKEGEVRLYELSYEGKKIILDILGPGSVFGDITLSETSPELRDFAEVSNNTRLCIISKQDFLKVLATKPQLALELLEETSRRLHEAENKIKHLALSDALTRLLAQLVNLAKTPKPGGKLLISRRLTHQELSEMIGTTRETTTHAINRLQRLGIIKITPERLIEIDQTKIEKTF